MGFKAAIVDVWDNVSIEVVRAAYNTFEKILKRVVPNKGQIIE